MLDDPLLRPGCWLTLNRACDMRCPWCYAVASGFGAGLDMRPETLAFCVEAAVSLGARRFILIGGEPLVYPRLLDAIAAVHGAGRPLGIVTNGRRLGDGACRARLLGALGEGDSVTVSLKGTSAREYGPLSGSPRAFADVREGLRGLARSGVRHSLSYVVTEGNVGGLAGAIAAMREMSDAPIGLSLCGPSIGGGRVCFAGEGRATALAENAPRELALVEAHGVTLHLNVPLCGVDGALVEAAAGRCGIRTGCHVLNRSGLVFDTNGDLLACNHLLETPMGVFGEDYGTPAELADYLGSRDCQRLWDELTRLPYEGCASCSRLTECAGGCPLRLLVGERAVGASPRGE